MAVRRRGEKRYEIVVYVGLDGGKRRQQSEMFHGTLKDARTREGELKRQALVRRGKATGHTFRELADEWQANTNHQPSTRYQTDALLRKHILPALGTRKLSDITREELRKFYRGLKLAPTTVLRIHGIVRAAFAYGVHDLEWIGKSPAEGGGKPLVPGASRAEPVVPDAAAVAATLTYLREKHPDLWVFVRLSAATGARRGEVCGFRWSDFDGHTIVKRRAVGLAKGGLYLKDTKTGARTAVALDRKTRAVIRWHRWRMSVRARSAGLELNPDGYLFSERVDGSVPWRPDSPTKRLRIYRDKGYCDTVQLRTLRHFVATQLIAAGVDVRTVANRLSHSRTSTTTDIYAAAVSEADRRAADTIGGVLG